LSVVYFSNQHWVQIYNDMRVAAKIKRTYFLQEKHGDLLHIVLSAARSVEESNFINYIETAILDRNVTSKVVVKPNTYARKVVCYQHLRSIIIIRKSLQV
jgi:hypothetical protein